MIRPLGVLRSQLAKHELGQLELGQIVALVGSLVNIFSHSPHRHEYARVVDQDIEPRIPIFECLHELVG